MVENLHIFYSFKTQHVANFTIKNEKITLLCKDMVSSQYGLDFQKFKCYSLLSTLPIKTKTSEIIFRK